MAIVLGDNYIVPEAPVEAKKIVSDIASLYSPNTWRLQEKNGGKPTGEYQLAIYNGILVWCKEQQAYYSFVGNIDSVDVNDNSYKWDTLFGPANWRKLEGGSGSVDTSNLVTLEGDPQTISGNKTFTGEVDFSEATVKGLSGGEGVEVTKSAIEAAVKGGFSMKTQASNTSEIKFESSGYEESQTFSTTSYNGTTVSNKLKLEHPSSYGFPKGTLSSDNGLGSIKGFIAKPSATTLGSTTYDYNKIVQAVQSGSSSTSNIELTLPSTAGTLATQEWVEGQGYVTLPEGTTINDLLDAKADNIPFTSTATTTKEVGGLASESDLNGKSIAWILSKLLGVVNFVAAPVITMSNDGTQITVKNPNDFPVTFRSTHNTCSIQYAAGSQTQVVFGDYRPLLTGKTFAAKETATASVDLTDYILASIQEAWFSGHFEHENGIESAETSVSR